MARKPRSLLDQHLTAIMIQSSNQLQVKGHKLFNCARDCLYYLNLVKRICHDQHIQLHAYGFTAQNAKILITPDKSKSIENMMRVVNRQYHRFHRQNYPNTECANLFANRYYSSLVDSSNMAMSAQIWIEKSWESTDTNNPSILSSQTHYTGNKYESGLSALSWYWELGNTPFERHQTYENLLGQTQDPQKVFHIDSQNRSILNNKPIGNEEFLGYLYRNFNIDERPKKRGRKNRLNLNI